MNRSNHGMNYVGRQQELYPLVFHSLSVSNPPPSIRPIPLVGFFLKFRHQSPTGTVRNTIFIYCFNLLPLIANRKIQFYWKIICVYTLFMSTGTFFLDHVNVTHDCIKSIWFQGILFKVLPWVRRYKVHYRIVSIHRA